MLGTLAFFAALLTVAGMIQALLGGWAVRQFAKTPAPRPAARPGVTILKPLYGNEPLLEAALASVCDQRYPIFQVVFGVQDPEDAALPVLERLKARFPTVDIAVVVDPRAHGRNRKIGNLINMLPAAKHDVLVIADSDVHCAPDYLEQISRTLAIPGTGLVTTLYAGLSATSTLAGKLGAAWVNHSFLPGALMARWLGRQDTLGATMALRRETLTAIGGLAMLADHIADDHILGKLVQGENLAVRLAATVVATTVPETRIAALYRHELRWARTILALVPVEFVLSAIQYPLFWALFAVLMTAADPWAVILLVLTWICRAKVAQSIDTRLGLVQTKLATPASIWLLPIRDTLSMVEMFASGLSDQVEWRGRVMHTGRDAANPEPDPIRTRAATRSGRGASTT